MRYRDYDVKEYDNGVIIEKVWDFNPVHVFECGQCFRWIRQEDGSYTGVAMGRVVNVKYSDGRMVIRNTNIQDFKNIWFSYFDLNRDYSLIKKRLAKDEIMKKAIDFGAGIRILNQDLWETLLSFIISANNRIPMIMKIVASISRMYGTELMYNEKSYFTFPNVEDIANSSLEELSECRAGFRCKYIIETARKVLNKEVDLERLKTMETDAARDELTKLPGVGNKVADCTLLYSGIRHNVFPTDVWVKRVMEELYFKRTASLMEIQRFSKEYFGDLSGFAQQYLFYYARENGIGKKK